VVEPGGTGRAFRDGTFGLGGRLPLNTAGGMLSALNGGLHLVLEAVRQLQGRTGQRQLPDPRRALVHGIGGVGSAHCALVLGR
jgi:acetyl-CoA acetyltransferase